MLKYVVVSLIVLFSLSNVSALPFSWGKNLAPKSFYGESNSNGLKYDDGYIYLYGTFKDTIDLDPGNGTCYVSSYTSYAHSGYLAKYDLMGNMIWGGSLVGIKTGNPNCPAPPYNSVNDIAFDANHNIYLTGYYDDSVRFQFNGNTMGLKCPCGVSSYILKLSPSGSCLTANHVTGMSCPTYFNGTSITVKGQSLYTMTEFYGESDFDFSAGSTVYTNTNYSDFHLVASRYNINTMALEWSGQLFSTSALYAARILVDNNNNMYVTGKFNGTMDMDFSSGTHLISSYDSTSLDYFIAKYNSNGSLLWVNQFTKPSSFEFDVTMDNAGNILLAGGLKGVLMIQLNGITQNTLYSSNASEDIFVAKIAQNGNTLWVKRIGGLYAEIFQGISVSPNDEVLLTGWFNVATAVDPLDTSNSYQVAGYATNGLLSCLSSSGTFLFGGITKASENPNNMNIGGSIYRHSTWDAGGNLYLSGRIIWNADIDPDTSSNGLHTLSNTNNNFNSFIMKLGNATNPTSINPASEYAQDIRLYPNPATTYCILESFQSKIRSIAIYTYTGQCVLQSAVDANSIRINTAHLPKGNFILRYETSDQKVHSIPLQIR